MRVTKKAFRTYIGLPLAGASIAATVMAAVSVFDGMTGYHGAFRTSHMPMSLWEAWTVSQFAAGLIFVVTFLVLVVWMPLRGRPRRRHRAKN